MTERDDISPSLWGTTKREALVSSGETNSWRAWEAIGPGCGRKSLICGTFEEAHNESSSGGDS